MHARVASHRGFTMIELAFVVTIIAILMVVALPRMVGAGSRTALETTARDIARMSEYARQTAIARQRVIEITFDPEARTWWMDLNPEARNERYVSRQRRSREAIHELEEVRRLEQKVSFREFLLDGKATDARRPVTVSYYPNGSSSGLTVILTNDRGRVMTMEVERATGRASAYLGEPMTFGDRLAAAGLDATRYGGTSAQVGGQAARDGFYMSAGGEQDRVSHYQDAAARIMGQVTRKYERTQEQQEAAQPNTRRDGRGGTP
ncbi:MAG: prepilin-type N-terminal cleavage/methylation domain-containing protein [Candidatus Sumerlaeia bacterium]|nr:prepilin-type N-terminal cleavage/methylation domain-containing protein [Candidatus Sumerlaeia bacterium]